MKGPWRRGPVRGAPMSQAEEYPNTDPVTSQSGKARRFWTPDAAFEQQARSPSPRQPGPPHRRTASQRLRLLPLALTALMVFGAVLAGPASASPAAGKGGSSEETAKKSQENRALARLVLSPAGASIRA